MMLRTKSEQKAYLDGFEMCAECIEKYLSAEGKKKVRVFAFSREKCRRDRGYKRGKAE